MNKKIIFVVTCLSLMISSCWNHRLTVENAWARPANMGDNSAVYFTIDNPTVNEDVLVNVESNIAEGAEIHMSMSDEDGIVKMEHQDSVKIEPRTRIIFQPGGLHVMLVNLQKDLKLNDKFNLVLNFQNAGGIQLEVQVSEP